MCISSINYNLHTMAEKSADPTPTMTMDSGKTDAFTIQSTVRSISVIMPS